MMLWLAAVFSMREIATLLLLCLLLHLCAVSILASRVITPLTIVLTHSRAKQLESTLQTLIKNTPSYLRHPIYVSIDRNAQSANVISVVKKFKRPNISAIWHHQRSEVSLFSPRARIARHYYAALSRAFANHTITHAIIIEDDLIVSPDFVAFMHAALPVLRKPKRGRLACASAWNDNAPLKYHAFSSERHVANDDVSFTSFFPGLGFALSRPVWRSLRRHWPRGNYNGAPVASGWDFWIRGLFQLRDWMCVYPVLPRVRHVGKGGVHVMTRKEMKRYDGMVVADVADGVVDWKGVMKGVSVEKEMRKRAKWIGGKDSVPFRRELYGKMARQMGLWPVLRGHLGFTIRLRVHKKDVLLYDERHARKWHARMLSVKDVQETVTAYVGRLNESCDETCERANLVCDAAQLEWFNTCHDIRKVFPKCAGCIYETGSDLPAFVAYEAPLETAGWCVITQFGNGAHGELTCDGRFQWTRRACACITNKTVILST